MKNSLILLTLFLISILIKTNKEKIIRKLEVSDVTDIETQSDYSPEYSDSDITTTDFFSTEITTNAINSNTIKMNTDNITDYIPNTTYNTYR